MVFVGRAPSATSRKTYESAYRSILAARRRSPSSSAASVVLLVAPDVDALCAARMLSILFRQDDVPYRIIPVSGFLGLAEIKEDLASHSEICALILVNIGSVIDLDSDDWFRDFDAQTTIHVIDSTRPQSLANLFDEAAEAQRIVVWDDGTANFLEKQKDFYLRSVALRDELGSDAEDNSSDSSRSSGDESSDSGESSSSRPSQRREGSESESDNPKPRRRRTQRRALKDVRKLRKAKAAVSKHFAGGLWHGQSAAGIIYVLATLLERADNDLLWLSILGLTYQLITARISLDKYLGYHEIFLNEVARLNPVVDSVAGVGDPDDHNIRPGEEIRFTMFRHWNLYDSMYHSSYVASKLGIWQESGRKKLSGLLAKMGFSLQQCQQTYGHMDMDLRRKLREQIDVIAPEYGLHDLIYPSFIRSFGFKSQPLSAADVVECVLALLQAASGVQLQVESLEGKGGGEWFGGNRLWDLRAKSMAEGNGAATQTWQAPESDASEDDLIGADGSNSTMSRWWVKNFWVAFDALGLDLSLIQEALPLAMGLQRAITRQGSSLIDKHAIRTFTTFRLAVLKEGPDLPVFGEASRLARLGMWLSEALRERQSAGRKGDGKLILPLVIACLVEKKAMFLVVGVTPTTETGDVRKNRFGTAFLKAGQDANAKLGHISFDAGVVQVAKDELMNFMEQLQVT